MHVSSNSPFGANANVTDRFTEDSEFAPYLAYGRSKLEAEELVQRSHARGDLATVIVRPPWFYGPFQPDRQTQFFAAIRRGRFPRVGDGTQRRSMVYTGNLVDALLLAEVAPAAAGRAYWIADAEPVRAARHPADGARRARGGGCARVGARARGSRGSPRSPRSSVDRALQSTGRYVQAVHVLGELKDTIACDITRARTELGYEPAVGLFEGMRESIRWCRARGAAL